MTPTVIHTTPGLIDPRAFTLMGVSAKPNTANPIGMFGTGLKYSVAVLMRMGARVTVYIGGDRYVFEKCPGEFRGQAIEHIVFRRARRVSASLGSMIARAWGRPTKHELPYTTEYGRFWKPWMVVRELHSNTLDEGGNSRVGGSYNEDAYHAGEGLGLLEGHTHIVVTHPDYAAAYANLASIFLPGAARAATPGGPSLELLPRDQHTAEGHQALYFRSLKVFDLPKPSLYLYNFLTPLVLTEDRTLASSYQARATLAVEVLKSEDEAFIRSVITAGEELWEHELEYPGWVTPGAAFRLVMEDEKMRGQSRASRSYWRSGWATPAPRHRTTREAVWSGYPGPWEVGRDGAVDSEGTQVLSRPDDMDAEDWQMLATEVVRRCGHGPEPEPVKDDEDVPW